MACLALNPRAKGGTLILLLGFYEMYAEWCTQAATKYNTHKEVRGRARGRAVYLSRFRKGFEFYVVLEVVWCLNDRLTSLSF